VKSNALGLIASNGIYQKSNTKVLRDTEETVVEGTIVELAMHQAYSRIPGNGES
jgi:hypothetical protein